MTDYNPDLMATTSPPVMQARSWIEGKSASTARPLINVSQAAPVDPPVEGLRDAMAEAVLSQPEVHLYGPVLGLPALRDELAANIVRHYGGHVDRGNIAITSGCNQAFCASIASLVQAGDEVILPSPWYFNHKMWLDMAGIKTVTLSTGADLLPDPEVAKSLITPRSRAIVLVTPNNPSGVEYPPSLIFAFYELAKAHGLALIVDETYRDFHSQSGAAHDLFTRPDWSEVLIHLYSFSKSYRLTGHRVGAIACSADRLLQIEKFLDSVTICPTQLGQVGALWGLRNLEKWLAGERLEILARAKAMRDGFAPLHKKGWRLLGCGAYFAYLEHPFEISSEVVAQALVDEAAILALPGTMFTSLGDPAGARQIRVAFANIDVKTVKEVLSRLESFAA
jgi:aspartate/methionine/tyrosine aminotransferase